MLFPVIVRGGADGRQADRGHAAWMGGLPADAPPRRGTPEYEEMMTKRAQEPRGRRQQQPNPRHLSSSDEPHMTPVPIDRPA